MSPRRRQQAVSSVDETNFSSLRSRAARTFCVHTHRVFRSSRPEDGAKATCAMRTRHGRSLLRQRPSREEHADENEGEKGLAARVTWWGSSTEAHAKGTLRTRSADCRSRAGTDRLSLLRASKARPAPLRTTKKTASPSSAHSTAEREPMRERERPGRDTRERV